MSALTKHVKTNTSGCVGVSLLRRTRVYSDGRRVVRLWWSAQCGKQVRRFSVDNLGNREAYHAAVQARAGWVREHAPLERARKSAKSRRNAATYAARYPEKSRKRHREYFVNNAAKVNRRRRARYANRKVRK